MTIDTENGHVSPKKKSKKRKFQQDKNSRDMVEVDDTVYTKKKKRKLKCDIEDEDNDVINTTKVNLTKSKKKTETDDVTTEIVKKKRKKKKKHDLDVQDVESEQVQLCESGNIKPKYCEDINVHYGMFTGDGEEVVAITEETSRKSKKKKKNKIKNGIDSRESRDDKEDHKGKTKHKLLENAEGDLEDNSDVNHGSNNCKKKKKKKRKHKEEELEEQKIKSEDVIMDNCSNSIHNNAAPGDFNNLSYNNVPFNYGSNTGRHVNKATGGQWKTASFESEERQQKFFRLMGGMKKGNNSSQVLCGKKQGNTAMNHDDEALLNTKLESEFDQAMSMKLSKDKSGGLGFKAPPGEGKKFYIDTSKSKSIKFDESD